MSMRDALFGAYPLPDETARVAHAAFPQGNIPIQLRDRVGMLFDNQHFAHLFAHEGRPAVAPVRLALVTIFQFMEGLSDRATADAVRDRISWKYALGLPLDDPGFHYSVLSEFRGRLLAGNAEVLLLDAVLDLCREVGVLKARGKQRSDSTHVLAAVRELHRLENVGETLRNALNQLAVNAPDWLRSQADASWGARYGKRFEQYRLPKADAERLAMALTIGQDGYTLLTALAAATTPAALRRLPAVETLRQVWLQQYYRSTNPEAPELRFRTSAEQPPCAQIISSPYDPEARYKTKRDTTWVGYKVHVTETCDDDTPSLITHVATTPATSDDCTLMPVIQTALAAKQLLPAEHYVDCGYTDARGLLESQRKHAVDLVGPVQAESTWQAGTPAGITVAQFTIDWEAQRLTCPTGNVSRTWSSFTDAQGHGGAVIRFARSDCGGCDQRPRCTRGREGRRTVTLRTREEHEALQGRRTEQRTPAFQRRYSRRAGIEGTFHQGNRRSDLRHARYRGLAKTHLQHILTAVALNLLRVIAWLEDVPRAKTRASPLTALLARNPAASYA